MTHSPRGALRALWACLSVLIGAASLPSAAHAIPAFTRQTGEPCASCHVGGFGPQLTATGQAFKISGYGATSAYSSGEKATNLGVSAMLAADLSHTARDQSAVPATGYGVNDNFALQEASAFLAGRITPGVGVFAQATYSGVDRAFAMDNLDLRFAKEGKIGGMPAVFGVSLNNNPTAQDPWNTLPAWGFPYHSSDLAPQRAASPLIAGGLGQQVFGLTPYLWLNHSIYVEAGAYASPSASMLKTLGATQEEKVDGAAPYWRVAYSHNLKGGSYSVGAFGLDARIDAGAPGGLRDHYNDVGFDMSYVRDLTGERSFRFNAAHVREQTTLDASVFLGDAATTRGHLDSTTVDASYYWKNIGATVGLFDTKGSLDGGLYAPGADSGSLTGKPDSNGMTFQIDWTPASGFQRVMSRASNLRLGLQYTAYGKFNGGRTNYDGFGRNASDNNTLALFAWAAF